MPIIHILTTKQLIELRANLIANTTRPSATAQYIEECNAAVAEIDELFAIAANCNLEYYI